MSRVIGLFRTAGLLALLLAAAPGCLTQQKASPSTSNQTTGSTGQAIGRVTLSWAANAGEQQGFYLEQSSDGVNYTVIQQLPDGTTTATVTGLLTGSSYRFRVRGYNALGDSPYSAVMTVVIP